ncbi:YigZ family protein [Chryseotalea sanaruensis]|uniref:YigZ family protein n=1 Tax=Chryseotalea sanaruensis TaxID=2482724 RepID=A0A401U5J1_9BACT|nr:YigZ family protein [Chryseotalea sanaruensis]GCC50142.1 YigZ family protein [Chryseotalea sanaruensis]
MTTSYRTVISKSAGQYKEKGSKFLAFCYPVANEEEVSGHLASLRKEYYDARHYCYAWVLGVDQLRHRANDDGEPNHSAGDPILGQIRSKDLTNTLIVVVRYFGGVKLGVGGLISAYKLAAEDALNNAIIEEKTVTATIKLYFPYESTSEIMRIIKEFDLKILEQTFDEACYLLLEGSVIDIPQALERFELLKKLGVKLAIES